MPTFTKDEMFEELVVIHLYSGDFIKFMTREETFEVAERIGLIVPPKSKHIDFRNLQPSEVSLKYDGGLIADLFKDAFDFAFNPSFITQVEAHEIKQVLQFMRAVPRAGISWGGDESAHRYMTPDGLCQMTADAAYARLKLSHDPPEDTDFSIRELALLADMSEGAVRNALADKSENGLRAISGSKPVKVELAEAQRWLAGRRGFIPMPTRLRDDRFVAEQLAAVRSCAEFGNFLKRLIEWPDLTVAGWSEIDVKPWLEGTFQFDVERACALARAIDLDQARFAGKALEVSLRRNQDMGEEP